MNMEYLFIYCVLFHMHGVEVGTGDLALGMHTATEARAGYRQIGPDGFWD